jgi:hypothetical protein
LKPRNENDSGLTMDRNRENEQAASSDVTFEHLLQRELHSVAVPEQLKDRLLERLRADAQPANPVDNLQLDRAFSTHETSRDTNAKSKSFGDGKPPLQSAAQATQPSARFNRENDPRGEFSRRWLGKIALSTAASLILAVLGWSWWQSGTSAEKLGEFCSQELAQVFNSPDWQHQQQIPLEIEAFAWNHLVLSQPSSAEQTSFAAGRFGSRGTLWRLADRRGELYIFVFEQPPSVTGVGKQLRLIADSGTWNLAACSSAGQLFVVASTEDVRQFFKAPSFA